MQRRSFLTRAYRARASKFTAALLSVGLPNIARAQTVPAGSPIERPVVLPNRWEENWSVLADPDVPRKAGDALKYIQLSKDDLATYLSLGADFRERLEVTDEPLFGTSKKPADTYVIQRLQVHADLRLGDHVQVFAQVEDARAFGRKTDGPFDENRLDLRQGFVSIKADVAGGPLNLRIGRQEIDFDLQRFISSRDGPNVRQAFDGFRFDWTPGRWRFIGLLSRPVQYRDARPFDDVSNHRFVFAGLRAERRDVGPGTLALFYWRYQRDGVSLPDATGDERRDSFDVRYSGVRSGLDWDLEVMAQRGSFGQKRVRAWAAGSRVGYTAKTLPMTPRLAMQFDLASGDTRSGDDRVGTFNPYFPTGYYFTLAGFTGYSNLVHVKPSLTVRPSTRITVTAASGLQWRLTTKDAVYVNPLVAVPGTAGRGGRWTGSYGQLRADLAVNRILRLAVEAVHYDAGSAIRSAGGGNADYLGLESRLEF